MSDYDVSWSHPRGWGLLTVTPETLATMQAAAAHTLSCMAALEQAVAPDERRAAGAAFCASIMPLMEAAFDCNDSFVPSTARLEDAVMRYCEGRAEQLPELRELRAAVIRLRDNADQHETAEAREERHADRYFTPEEAEEYERGIAERRAEDRYNDDFYYGGRSGY